MIGLRIFKRPEVLAQNNMVVDVTTGIEFEDNERFICFETILELELTRLRLQLGLTHIIMAY